MEQSDAVISERVEASAEHLFTASAPCPRGRALGFIGECEDHAAESWVSVADARVALGTPTFVLALR